jgi:hypothetical protein
MTEIRMPEHNINPRILVDATGTEKLHSTIRPAKIQDLGQTTQQSELDAANQELAFSIDNLRSKIGAKASTAKILSIIHSCPCPMKCVNDIKNSVYSNDIDRLYIEKHEYVKKKIIDAIQLNFGRSTSIKSEHKINNGTLDIVILYDKIILNYHEKSICIEIKSGRSIDLFQIERYLYESYVLIVVRVPTRDVVPIHQTNIADELIAGINSTIKKIDLLNENNLLKVQGEWCKGCTANCEFSKKVSKNSHIARLEFEEFFKNVSIVTDETIRVLKEEMYKL